MMRLVPLLLLLGLGACGGGARLPETDAASLDTLAAERPTAILFSTKGCRYCDIAVRGFAGAARELGEGVHVRKVMLNPDNVRALRARFGVASTPEARLLLANGRIEKLPLTREGPAVAKAVRDAMMRKAEVLRSR